MQDVWAITNKTDSLGYFTGVRAVPAGAYANVLAKVGKTFGLRSDETVPHRIRGPAKVLGSAVSYESARSSTDRGHVRVLIERQSDYFVAGCKFSTWSEEFCEHYVHGPTTLEALQSGPKQDLALLNACGVALVKDL